MLQFMHKKNAMKIKEKKIKEFCLHKSQFLDLLKLQKLRLQGGSDEITYYDLKQALQGYKLSQFSLITDSELGNAMTHSLVIE